MTSKETYEKLRKKFPELPGWSTMLYFSGVPKEEDLADVYHVVNIFRGSVSSLLNNFMSILTPTNFASMQDQKLCKDERDRILESVIKCGYILRQSMVDLMDATLKPDYENRMVMVAKWIAEEARPELKFFHQHMKGLAEKWKNLKAEESNRNHFSY